MVKPGNGFAAVLTFIGGVAMIVGGFLPYVRTHTGDLVHTVNGWSATGDAQATVAIGGVAIVLAALLMMRAMPAVVRLLVLVGGIAGIALSAFDLYDITQRLPKNEAVVNAGIDTVEVGLGLFVVLGGAIVLLLSSLVIRSRKKPSPAGAVPVGAPPVGGSAFGGQSSPPAAPPAPAAPPMAPPPAPAAPVAPPMAPPPAAPPTQPAPPMAPPPAAPPTQPAPPMAPPPAAPPAQPPNPGETGSF